MNVTEEMAERYSAGVNAYWKGRRSGRDGDAIMAGLQAALAPVQQVGVEPVAWQRYSERDDSWSAVDAGYAQTLRAGGELVRALVPAASLSQLHLRIAEVERENERLLRSVADLAKQAVPDHEDETYWRNRAQVAETALHLLQAEVERRDRAALKGEQ